MSRPIGIATAGLLACGVILGATVRAAPPSRPADALAGRVDAYLKPFVDGGNFSGVVLIARGGKPAVQRACGMADYELGAANTMRTRFHIASVSKTFTAAAILLLEAEGRLSTSAPISRWIPEFSQGDRTTLTHLLTHTSGIPDINNTPGYEAESKKPHTPADLVQLIRALQPESAPGEKYRYSNSNYNILAYVIERVSGQPYGEFLAQRIFRPLGMTDTGHDGDAGALIPGRAEGYVPAGLKGFGRAPYLDWSMKTGNGSLYSTAGDLLKFDQALADGRLLSREIVDRILAAGSGNVYGWFVVDKSGRRLMRASGRSPGFTAEMDRYLDDRLTVIVLANTYSTAAQTPIAADLAALALGQPVAAPRNIAPKSVPAAALSAWAGSYAGGDDFFFPGTTLAVTPREGWLLMHWSTGADSILAPVGEGEFLDRSFWARVRFVRDDGGAVKRLVWSYDGRDYPAVRAQEP